MISRIQNVSFTGAKQRVANKVVKNMQEAYVSASSNLEGTINNKLAERQLRDAKFAEDKDTFAGRIASLLVAKRNIEAPKVEVAKEAIPMPTPAEIAEAYGISCKNGDGAFNFFG